MLQDTERIGVDTSLDVDLGENEEVLADHNRDGKMI